MRGVKITCPSCGRILGDTKDSVDCNFNCRGCKKTVRVKITVAKVADYLNYNKEEKKDGKSE